MLSDEDKRFIAAAVGHRDEHIQALVDKGIQKHSKDAIFHNPVKASIFFSGIALIWEQVRKIWTH